MNEDRYCVFGTMIVLICLFTGSCAVNASEPALTIGVLEENVNVSAFQSGIHQNYSRHVRVAFQKDGADWKAFPSFSPPSEMNWTITFSGKSIGQISSRKQQTLEYSAAVGFQGIARDAIIPTIGQRSMEYAGWQHEPVYRPLVAVSQPNFKDPDGWKTAKLSDDLTQIVRQSFQQKFPSASNCTSPDENISKPWAYKESDIKIMQAYASKNHWAVVQMSLPDYRCDGPLDEDSPFYDQWFVISPDHNSTFLGAGMWLVDASDYDGSGQSELVFSLDGYNSGGYKLFYDGFKKQATFEFNYH